MRMARTTVDVDEQALEMARAELGTSGLSATVNAALRDVARRRALSRFDVLRDIDGTAAEVEANRRERFLTASPEPLELERPALFDTGGGRGSATGGFRISPRGSMRRSPVGSCSCATSSRSTPRFLVA